MESAVSLNLVELPGKPVYWRVRDRSPSSEPPVVFYSHFDTGRGGEIGRRARKGGALISPMQVRILPSARLFQE